MALFCAISIAGAQTPAGAANQSVRLEQQLQELKQQYAETTRALEQRIAALEQQIEKAKGGRGDAEGRHGIGGGTGPGSGREGRRRRNPIEVGAKFQGQMTSEPTYDLLREADQKIEKLEEQVKGFEFHGYFRSGYG